MNQMIQRKCQKHVYMIRRSDNDDENGENEKQPSADDDGQKHVYMIQWSLENAHRFSQTYDVLNDKNAMQKKLMMMMMMMTMMMI